MKIEDVLSREEVAVLPEAATVRDFVTDAAARAASAASLHDAGIARGLLLSLYKLRLLNASQFDRLFKAVWVLVPEAVRLSVPEDLRADLGKGVVVPAAPRTRKAAR